MVRHAGREGGIQSVQIHREVDRTFHDWAHSGLPRPHVDHFDTKPLRLALLVAVHRSDPDLHQPPSQSLFHDPGERAGVREAVPLELVVQVGMGIDVEDRELGVVSAHGTKDRVGNGVIATEREGVAAVGEQTCYTCLDPFPASLIGCKFEVAGITQIGDVGTQLGARVPVGRPKLGSDERRRLRRPS
jgi:hypothetical protein